MPQKPEPGSYDWECFQVLAYELPDEDPSAAERKIRARLRRKRLGKYDQAKINELRALKDELEKETRFPEASRYYLGPKGATADFADYDVARMAEDLYHRHPLIPRYEIQRAINFSVYIHYVR